MIAASRRTFDKYGLSDRVRMIEGDALQSLKTLTGTFDLIFVDANKDGYEAYVKYILDQKLLSPAGLIMADNSKNIPQLQASDTKLTMAQLSLRSRNDYLY